jgi:PhnO protein
MATKMDLEFVFTFICLLENERFDLMTFRQLFWKNMEDGDCHMFIADSAEAGPVGFINIHVQRLLHHCGKVAEIQELYIDPSHRRQGLGRELMRKSEDFARKEGCVLLEVAAQNRRTDTHLFYEQSGFTMSHRKFTLDLT